MCVYIQTCRKMHVEKYLSENMKEYIKNKKYM